MARTAAPETWGHSTVRTACPLDCPDACTLDVTVENGRVQKIDGGDDNPVTRNFICAKVRRFDERRLRRGSGALPVGPPGRRRGRAPSCASPGTRRSTSSPAGCWRSRQTAGAEAILPYYYGGSNGLLTQNTNDAELWRRFGTSRLATTICAAPTGAASLALYGKMADGRLPGLSPRQADHPLGRQPVGVGHPPHPLHQGRAGRRRDAGRDRPADDVAREDRRTCTWPCGPAPTCRSRSRCTG